MQRRRSSPIRGPKRRLFGISQGESIVASFALYGIGYVNSNAFGASEVRAEMDAVGYVNAQVFGGAALNGQIGGTSYVNANAFGSAEVRSELDALSYVNANLFGSGQLLPQPVTPSVVYGGGYWPAMPKLKPLWTAPHYLVGQSFVNVSHFGTATFGNVLRLKQRKQKQQRQLVALTALRLAA